MIKIKKIKDNWEVRRIGNRWHIHLGKGLVRQLWRCFKFEIRGGGKRWRCFKFLGDNLERKLKEGDYT